MIEMIINHLLYALLWETVAEKNIMYALVLCDIDSHLINDEINVQKLLWSQKPLNHFWSKSILGRDRSCYSKKMIPQNYLFANEVVRWKYYIFTYIQIYSLNTLMHTLIGNWERWVLIFKPKKIILVTSLIIDFI